MATKIRGIEGMKNGELDFEIQRGGKFVLFQYCISIVVITFRRPSDIYFLRQGESAVTKGLPFTLLSLVAGWWGIPWGPIYTIQSAYNNSRGGKDVTQAAQFAARASGGASGRFPNPGQELSFGSFADPASSSKIEGHKSGIIRNGLAMGLRKPKTIKHNGKKLREILEAHELFFRGKDGGARADLTGADLSNADLSGLNFSGAILRNARLEGSDLRTARLPGADLSGARLRNADLRNTDMTEAILPGADLTGAQASGVEFFRCDLSNACFERACLRNVNLRGARVTRARFSGADMGVAILRETDLTGADFSGVDLSTALLPKGFSAPQTHQDGQAAKKSA